MCNYASCNKWFAGQCDVTTCAQRNVTTNCDNCHSFAVCYNAMPGQPCIGLDVDGDTSIDPASELEGCTYCEQ